MAGRPRAARSLSFGLTDKKYSQTDKPHVRMTELVLIPAKLSFVDIATSTHNHTDHLGCGNPFVRFSPQIPNLKLVIARSQSSFRRGATGRSMLHFRSALMTEPLIEISGIRFSGVASAHETVERDELGRARFLGYVLQFGGWTIYHSGDTVRYRRDGGKTVAVRSRCRPSSHQRAGAGAARCR